VLTKNGIRTLTNIIIVDPMQMDLLPWSCATKGFDASNTIQAKENNYRDQHPINQFLPLAIEVFGCPHKQGRCVFTHLCQCHLEFERARGPSSFCLDYFFCQKISITL
jgi:hypothetical protein